MKLYRLTLVCTLLLLAAVPTFAAPPCGFCENEGAPGSCIFESGGTFCRFSSGICVTKGGACTGFADRPLVNEWNVASIEITRPDPATQRLATVVITPTAIEGVTAQLIARK